MSANIGTVHDDRRQAEGRRAATALSHSTTGFMVILALGLLAVSCAAQAQAAMKVPRIGLLSVGADPAQPVVWFPFLERLRELGYVDG